MPKQQLDVHELVGTDANFVSLVTRGANRVPFRITKEDTPMDLYKIGRTLFQKTAATTPQIVAALISKSADMEQVAQIFVEAGLDPKQFQKSEKDGVIVVALPGYADAEDTAILKMSDDIGIVVSGLQKGFDGWADGSSDFQEVLKISGHYVSMRNAMDAFSQVAHNALYKADAPSSAAAAISKAADDLKTYLVTLTQNLPVHAFKMDQQIQKMDYEKKKKMPKNKDMASDPDKDSEDPKADMKKQADPGPSAPLGSVPSPDGFAAAPTESEAAKARATADDASAPSQDGGTSGSSLPDGTNPIPGGVKKEEAPAPDFSAIAKAAVEPLLDQLKTLQAGFAAMADVAQKVEALSQRVDSVAEVSRKTEEALSGTVFGAPEEDGEKLRKSDRATSAPPLLDTAYSARSGRG